MTAHNIHNSKESEEAMVGTTVASFFSFLNSIEILLFRL